jgi:hypothetical protein
MSKSGHCITFHFFTVHTDGVSQNQSYEYFATDGRSVRPSVLALNPPGTHDQILALVKTIEVYGWIKQNEA